MWKEKEATAALQAVIQRQGLETQRICVAFGSDRGRYTSGSHGVVDVRHPAARTLEEPGSGNVYQNQQRSRGSSLKGTGIECDGERNTTRTTMWYVRMVELVVCFEVGRREGADVYTKGGERRVRGRERYYEG